jgi:hypothetical protein
VGQPQGEPGKTWRPPSVSPSTPGDRWHLDLADGKIAAAEGSSPKHPLLAAALAAAAKHQGKSLKSRLPRIQKAAGWSQVVDGMVDRGMLGREKSTLRPTRHPVLDEAGQDEVLRRVRQAAVGDGPLEPRTATLLALAGPCHLLEVVAPERSDRRRAKQRIAEATEHVPAAVAVKKTIEAMETAGSVSSG